MMLRDIDPAAFAAELVERVREYHTMRLILDVDQSADVQLGGLGGNLERAAHVLCHYAQTGQEPDDAPITGYLQSYCEALWSGSVSCEIPTLDSVRGVPTEAHALVLGGALARDLLAQGEPISLRDLAVLSGAGPSPVSRGGVRNLAARGRIQTTGATGRGARPIEAAEARRWLASRGVPGV